MGVGTDTVRGRKVVADGDRETEYSVGKAGLCGKLGIGCWKKKRGKVHWLLSLMKLRRMISWDRITGKKQRVCCNRRRRGWRIKKAGCCPEDIRIIFAGDLLAQSIASSFGIGELERPMYGVFGACSTMGEALSLGAITVSAGHGERVLAVTSSHFATAEKEFRFPLGYGNQRPLSASWTVTGSGACVLNRKKGRVKITGLTIGKVVDYGLKDSQNMGACMAPAACSTIVQNLKDFGRKPEEYDQIITGDLGYIGQQILLDLLEKEGYQAGKITKIVEF